MESEHLILQPGDVVKYKDRVYRAMAPFMFCIPWEPYERIVIDLFPVDACNPVNVFELRSLTQDDVDKHCKKLMPASAD